MILQSMLDYTGCDKAKAIGILDMCIIDESNCVERVEIHVLLCAQLLLLYIFTDGFFRLESLFIYT